MLLLVTYHPNISRLSIFHFDILCSNHSNLHSFYGHRIRYGFYKDPHCSILGLDTNRSFCTYLSKWKRQRICGLDNINLSIHSLHHMLYHLLLNHLSRLSPMCIYLSNSMMCYLYTMNYGCNLSSKSYHLHRRSKQHLSSLF